MQFLVPLSPSLICLAVEHRYRSFRSPSLNTTSLSCSSHNHMPPPTPCLYTTHHFQHLEVIEIKKKGKIIPFLLCTCTCSFPAYVKECLDLKDTNAYTPLPALTNT